MYILNRNKNSQQKYFYAGTRRGQILHTRLCLECSSQNRHPYKMNIVNSLCCSFGGFKSPYRFFFACPKYGHIKNTYLPDVLQLHTTIVLLYVKGTANDVDIESRLL